jgi:hypothetical protein
VKRILVRYRTRPDQAETNSRLIENVFAELRERSPADVRYATFRLADGTFVHIFESETDAASLLELEAFRRFQSGIKERSVEPPVVADATIVGDYRMLAGGAGR